MIGQVIAWAGVLLFTIVIGIAIGSALEPVLASLTGSR